MVMELCKRAFLVADLLKHKIVSNLDLTTCCCECVCCNMCGHSVLGMIAAAVSAVSVFNVCGHSVVGMIAVAVSAVSVFTC